MADISNPVVYPDDVLLAIDQALARNDFHHGLWSDECLEVVRGHIRRHYREVQFGICAYCRAAVSLQSSLNCHVEHIAPKSIYQKFIFEPRNLCVICADCNVIKRDQEVMAETPDPVIRGGTRKRYPKSSSAFKIVHPHFDVYDEHIEKFDSFYVEKSEKGHFTIGACRLNRRMREFGWEATFQEADVTSAAEDYLAASEPLARSRALNKLKRILVLV